uniref:Uncharacterized protein n=1 Tax=Cannabis sativa TaxID=3483 RepID=A0A803QUA0_CANSA
MLLIFHIKLYFLSPTTLLLSSLTLTPPTSLRGPSLFRLHHLRPYSLPIFHLSLLLFFDYPTIEPSR